MGKVLEKIASVLVRTEESLKHPCRSSQDPPPGLSGRPSPSGARDSPVSSPLVVSKLEASNRSPKQIELRPPVHRKLQLVRC